MSKKVDIILNLKDKMSQNLNKIKNNLTMTNERFKIATNNIKKFSNAVKAGMKKIAKWAVVGFGALTAGAVLFVKQGIDIAKEKLKADKLLETNLLKQSKATKEHIQMLKDEASALQDVGVVGDDVAVAGASRLAVFKMNADQIKKTMPILDDMIAFDKGLNGTQEDAIAIGELYGKAINGKVNALKKYGVVLTANEEKLFKVMSTEQRIEFINKKLEKSIGGTNKALRATDEGKIVAMKGAWGDMQAELGKKLMPKLGNLAEWFHSKIPTIQEFILSLADKVEEMINKAKPYIEDIKEKFGAMFEKIKPALDEAWEKIKEAKDIAIAVANDIINNWDRISPVVYTVIGAMVAYKVALLAVAIQTNAVALYTKVKTAWDIIQSKNISILTVKQWALNTAMNANPIGLVIGAIAVLVGSLWLLYKNWDLVKAKVQELWVKLDKNPLGKVLKFIIKFGNPIGGLINLFLFFKRVITENWDTIKGFGEYIWNGLVGAFNYVSEIISGVCSIVDGVFTAIWSGVISVLGKLKNAFNKVTDFLTGIFMSAWDSLMKALDMVLHPIETAKKAFGGLINLFLFFKRVITENWDTIKGFGEYIWNGLVGAFNYVKDVIVGLCKVIGGIFTAVWDGVISALDKLKAGFNKVTDFITGVFQSAWDSLMKALDMVLHPIETAKKAFGGLIDKLKFWNNTKIEDKTVNINEVKTTDSIGGSNKSGTTSTTIAKNPRHALGTAYFKGGVTGINEGGRNETAILPAGTQILSHEQGKAINNKMTKGITININVDGNFIGEKEQMEKYAEYTTNKVLATLGNM